MAQNKNIVAQVDYQLSLNAKSGAASDGQDTNKVTAKLSANGVLVHNKEVTLQVDGHAVFANGEQSTSGMTDIFGEVSGKLTNTRSETVTITAKSEGKTETATSIFGDGEGTDYTLTLTSESGVQANTLTATLLNGDVPVSGETIKFSTNGSALFSNNQQEITATTNGDGKAVVSLTDRVYETVTVTAAYEDTTTSTASSFEKFLYTDIPDSIPTISNPTECHAYLSHQASGRIYMTITSPAHFYPSRNHSLTVDSGEMFKIDVDTGDRTKATISLKSNGFSDLNHVCVFE